MCPTNYLCRISSTLTLCLLLNTFLVQRSVLMKHKSINNQFFEIINNIALNNYFSKDKLSIYFFVKCTILFIKDGKKGTLPFPKEDIAIIKQKNVFNYLAYMKICRYTIQGIMTDLLEAENV